METNEGLRKALMTIAEIGMEQLVQSIQEVAEGNLQDLEQQILVQIMGMGRDCLERILEHQAERSGSVARREGGCGHHQRLVKKRPRQVLTLFGLLTIHRAYYQCLKTDEQEEDQKKKRCSHGEAPFDQQWGLTGQRSSPGVQKMVSYLSAQLTQEGVAEAVSRLLPFPLSARQTRNVAQPVGEAFLRREDSQVQEILKQGMTKRTSEAERPNEPGEPIKRLYVETDGVFARLRRGSVVMEKAEQERSGDVYRDIKVGAVFVGQPGHERSELAPGVFVDVPGPIRYMARRATTDVFALCCTPWPKGKASRVQNKWSFWEMEPAGSGV